MTLCGRFYSVVSTSAKVRFGFIVASTLLILSLTTTASAQSGASATFLRSDPTTQGNWHGAYGADGYAVSGDSENVAAYATFSILNQQDHTWAGSTTDQRALQTADGASGIAATWYQRGRLYMRR
jgi:hypothetical protein